MLRSAATPSRTEVHHEPPMKQSPTRNHQSTPNASASSSTPSPPSKIPSKPPISVRLFKA